MNISDKMEKQKLNKNVVEKWHKEHVVEVSGAGVKKLKGRSVKGELTPHTKKGKRAFFFTKTELTKLS